jgi:hypothetical protein
MATPQITSAVHDGHTYSVGDRVCVTGIGTAAPTHRHGYVKRFTKSQMVVEVHIRRNGQTIDTVEYKYWTDRAYGREVGAFEWGGSDPHPTCARPAAK